MAETTADPTTAEAITATWRAESARLVGALTRMTRDLDLAEDLAQDALLSALERWPADGVPANPAAWLMTTAKRRAIDTFRRADTLRRKTAEIGHDLSEEDGMPDLTDQIDFIEDDVLRLIFLSCHPSLTPESRAALTLRLVGGLTTAEIARGFLVPEKTMGQRISRAKRTLAEAGVELELPAGQERLDRLDDVMAVIYLVFNEGYAATAGEDWMRPELTREAIRLARMLAGLVPDEPEVHGLQALLELQASRGVARVDPEGRPVLLEDQDRRLWDDLLIRRGLDALARAERLAATGRPVGRYFLQAEIASCHARAREAEETDWERIAALYDGLARISPSPVVELNRGVATAQAFGPEAGLEIVLPLFDVPGMRDYHLLPAVAGDLLCRSGAHEQAREHFLRAAAMTRNGAERTIMQGRAADCASGHPTSPPD